MAWLKLDDQIFLNRKVAQCDTSAKMLYIVGLSYCANQLTDGFIPEATLPLLAGMAGLDWQIAKQSASKLLDVCLWSATQNGWQIPDYLEYNPSREQVIHNAQVRADAGKAGGRAKASKLPSKPLANGKQNPGKSLPPSPSPSPLKRDEGLQRPQASVPVYPQEPADPEYGIALSKLEALGMVTGSAKLELDALWPDLSNGRREWVDDAIKVAQANEARAPIYAIRVLAGAVAANKRPGSTPERKSSQAPQGRNLKKLLGLEDDDGISPFSAKPA